jgi:hypothetical protein
MTPDGMTGAEPPAPRPAAYPAGHSPRRIARRTRRSTVRRSRRYASTDSEPNCAKLRRVNTDANLTLTERSDINATQRNARTIWSMRHARNAPTTHERRKARYTFTFYYTPETMHVGVSVCASLRPAG